MSERSGLSVRHDDNALSRTEQPLLDPLIESRLEVFGCETVEESYPGPREPQLTQQICHSRRLVAVGLHDGRSPAAQHVFHPQGHSPVEGPAVLDHAMLNAGLPKVVRELDRKSTRL